MKKLCYILIFLISLNLSAITLKEAYQSAVPQNGYDKFLELETGVVYTGGLLIGKVIHPVSGELYGKESMDVKIVGNGAIIDLQGEQLSISMCDNILDIEDCVVINGNVRYRGQNTANAQYQPIGTCNNITFYRPDDYGVRIQGAGTGINVHHNLVVDAIDTGYDYIYTNGLSSDAIPTGHNFSGSVQAGFYGYPTIEDNWSYRFEDDNVIVPLHHFSLL